MCVAKRTRISFFWKMDQKLWTLERDKELTRHMAAGLSAREIAALFHTTRNSVLGRIFRLRNKLSPAKLEQLKRQKITAAEARKKAMAKKYAKAAAEARGKAGPLQDKILAAVRADLAAGIDRDVVIKRAVAGGANCGALAEVFGLSRWRVYEIAGPGLRPPSWTDKQVELLMSMWPDHSAQEIADVLGTGRNAVLGKIWRTGLRKPESSTSARGHSRAA
jgi:hypothetical protein